MNNKSLASVLARSKSKKCDLSVSSAMEIDVGETPRDCRKDLANRVTNPGGCPVSCASQAWNFWKAAVLLVWRGRCAIQRWSEHRT